LHLTTKHQEEITSYGIEKYLPIASVGRLNIRIGEAVNLRMILFQSFQHHHYFERGLKTFSRSKHETFITHDSLLDWLLW